MVGNTNFKKFDGVLREVISGSKNDRAELETYLQQLYLNYECVYGIHATDSALITCIINNRSGDHLHFVDRSDGGYAAAAEKMKQQIR